MRQQALFRPRFIPDFSSLSKQPKCRRSGPRGTPNTERSARYVCRGNLLRRQRWVYDQRLSPSNEVEKVRHSPITPQIVGQRPGRPDARSISSQRAQAAHPIKASVGRDIERQPASATTLAAGARPSTVASSQSAQRCKPCRFGSR